GESPDERVLLVDVKVDLDVANPRDYPYLAYFADPSEWMILVRQPHCWRFLYPLAAGMPSPPLPSSARRSFASSVPSTTCKSSTPSSTASTIASRVSGAATACS